MYICKQYLHLEYIPSEVSLIECPAIDSMVKPVNDLLIIGSWS